MSRDFMDTTDLPDMNDTGSDSGLPAEIDGVAEEITLESILAEYKGSAFIAGEKKTPPDILQEKADKIVLETTGRLSPSLSAVKDGMAEDAPESPADSPLTADDGDKSFLEQTKPLPSLEGRLKAGKKPLRRQNKKLREEDGRAETSDDDDNDGGGAAPLKEKVISFEQLSPPPARPPAPPPEPAWAARSIDDEIAREVELAIAQQTKLEEETEKSVRKVFGLFRRRPREVYDEYDDDLDEDSEEQVRIIEDEMPEEPDYRAAIKRFAEKCNVYSLRSFISLVISLVMALLTVIYQSNTRMPLGFSDNKIVNTGVLMILLFIVMIFSVDHLITGFLELFKGKNGIDALNLFSCLATTASGAYTLITRNTSVGVPFCVVSAFSLTFTLWGEKLYYRGLTESMKTALSVGVPYGVIAERSRELDRTVIKKAPGRTAGFYNNLIQADVSETAFNYAAPILIVASVVLGLYSALGTGHGQYFLHNFAAVMAAAAPFSAIFAYTVPFIAVNKRARQYGAVVAGWGGADDLYHADGASITDEDLFPQGTVSISGIKIFEEVSPEKALRYTASLIIASDSGLSKIFSDLLNKQGMTLIRVEDFTCYEGGIGGTVRGERVYVGSAAFMNLQGIRVPASLNAKNAIFTAVNKKLIAVFSIDYVPVKTVQNALISILRYRVKLYFAVRDFNITPVMLEQKYKVSVDNVEYIPIKESYNISDGRIQEAKRVSAVLTREGLGPYVEAVTGGRRLLKTAIAATVFSILSAVGGMLIMFAICWTGTFSAASAGNLLLYMLSMLCITLIICGFAKYRQ